MSPDTINVGTILIYEVIMQIKLVMVQTTNFCQYLIQQNPELCYIKSGLSSHIHCSNAWNLPHCKGDRHTLQLFWIPCNVKRIIKGNSSWRGLVASLSASIRIAISDIRCHILKKIRSYWFPENLFFVFFFFFCLLYHFISLVQQLH